MPEETCPFCEIVVGRAPDGRRATAEPHSGVTRCASCTVRAATYLNIQSQALCCTCAQCDCGQIPCARLDPALACRATLATEDHGTIRCYFPAGHYGPGRVHEAWAGDRRWWLDGDPGAVPHQADAPDEAEDDPGRTVRTRPDPRPSTVRDGGGRPTRTPALGAPRTERPPALTCTDGDRPGEDGTSADGSGRAVRDRRTEIRKAIEGAFLADTPSGIRSLLDHVGIDTTGRSITVAGRCVDPAPAAEERHPAVTARRQCWDRVQAAEDQLAAVRDVITDMEATTGARHWARLLRQAAGEPGDSDGGPRTWRRRAVRRALELSRAHALITAACDLAHETAEEQPGSYSDGYDQALADLRDVLTAFGHLPAARPPCIPDHSVPAPCPGCAHDLTTAELVHRCTNPQAAALVEVDDCPIPIVHARPPKEDGTR